MPELPVEEIIPQLCRALDEHGAGVLIAPPGAGKTTQVPLALLNQPWLAGRKILMLEPRRLAARNAAIWMARQLGEDVGHTVGYRMRLDSKLGLHTRIEVVTEGILTRLLQQDPSLEAYGLVIFDEFHERNLQADIGLALCLDARGLREELRLLVMSATLEGEPVSHLLGHAPVIHSEGRQFPIEIRYRPMPDNRQLEAAVVEAVFEALNEQSGSILVFLPGMAEIHRVHDAIAARLDDASVSLHPLYGTLSQSQQESAIAPAPTGTRKLVLASAIAETSLTIEGVRVVIDAGLMRVPGFDPGSGMSRLHTRRVTRASADQRCGRAGRLEPGVCYRLWDESTQAGLLAQGRAEILEADLAPLALELAQWGVTSPSQLDWLDPPPEAAFEQARSLLQSLQALDSQGRITAHGRSMLGLGIHPRLAHMVIRAEERGLSTLACHLAATLGERDPFRLRAEERQVDLRSRLESLEDKTLQQRYRADRPTLQRIRQSARDLLRRLGHSSGPMDASQAGPLLALAYPDRIAQRRRGEAPRYRLSNGKGARLGDFDALAQSPYLVAAELDGRQGEARIFLAAPIDSETLEQYFSTHIIETDRVGWDLEHGRVQASRQRCLGQLVLEQTPLSDLDATQISEALLDGIRQQGIGALPWNAKSRNWQQRVRFLRQRFPEQDWPDVSDAGLLQTLEQWLLPYLNGMNKLSQLQALDLATLLAGMLDWEKQQALARLAPTHIKVPSGSNITIDYSGDEPVLAVRLQELFGLNDTPTIAEGRVPLLLHLLSPAQRPMQVTRDLRSFWQNTYAEVKKDLKGRYPKHYWPDDPLQAEATRRARPRKT
ncbi:MAG: ATP-dependent helicase HrpB [Gammaproteobacteria bacterium]|nr:ATP-dependent helicase HrpB [Gammaproteobacteria bacterium]